MENLTWYGGKGRTGRSGSDVRMLINETAAIVDFVMNNQVQILLSGLLAVNLGKCSRGGRRRVEDVRREAEERMGNEPSWSCVTIPRYM